MKVQLLIEDASEPDALPGSGSRLLHPVLNVSSEADHAVLEMTKEVRSYIVYTFILIIMCTYNINLTLLQSWHSI